MKYVKNKNCIQKTLLFFFIKIYQSITNSPIFSVSINFLQQKKSCKSHTALFISKLFS